MAKCPYCGITKDHKDAMVDHINDFHGAELNKSHMDAAQALYASTHNGSIRGRCMICGGPCDWNYKVGKPYKLCGNPKCTAEVKKRYDRNRDAKLHKSQTELMQDKDHQRKMLANRKISGRYKFQDGGSVDYTGKLELSFLKFCDQILELKSYEVLPSPETFTYVDPKDQKTHIYDPDRYLIEYNLIVEIKDGGDHPNTNPKFLEETRYKVALKDEVMKRQTKYNYIRIGGTNYGPLMEMLFQIAHEKKTTGPDKKNLVMIVESANEPEEIEKPKEKMKNNFVLLVGRDPNTATVTYVALTDGSHWYVSDMLDQELYEALNTNPVFSTGSYEFYRYVGGNDQALVNAATEIATLAMAGHTETSPWSIPEILFDFGIFLDGAPDIRNNPWRRMDFVKVDQYFAKPLQAAEEDDE